MKILIDAKQGLGDCVQLIPMLMIIRENYPNCHLALLVRDKTSSDLLSLSPVKIDKFYYLNSNDLKSLKIISLLKKLRNEKFDYFILSPITNKCKAKVFAAFVNANNTIGEQYKSIDIYERDNSIHMVKRNIDLIKSFCKIPKRRVLPVINIEKYDGYNFEIEHNDKNIVGICIGGGTASHYKGKKIYPRGWDIVKINQLIIELMKTNYKIFLFGGNDEIELLNKLSVDLESPNIYNFVGKTNIVETAYLASKCKMVIGVDTGVQHIADALGIKTISIFGPTNPYTHGAYSEEANFIYNKINCQFCYGTKDYLRCTDRKCLKSITCYSVFQKVIVVLNNGE